VILKPLSPREVSADQLKMKMKMKKNKKNREKKRRREASRRKVKRVLLARRELLYLLPTNICFHVSPPLFVLHVGFREMLESFKDLFPKDIPRGIEHHIDFTMRAILPNKTVYKVNLEENRENHQVGKLVEKGRVQESKKPMVVPVILVQKKDGS
ncbi:hypothetical protein CR513_26210, partial [Mucuna pruriens]